MLRKFRIAPIAQFSTRGIGMLRHGRRYCTEGFLHNLFKLCPEAEHPVNRAILCHFLFGSWCDKDNPADHIVVCQSVLADCADEQHLLDTKHFSGRQHLEVFMRDVGSCVELFDEIEVRNYFGLKNNKYEI